MKRKIPFRALSSFAQGYIEALFFTSHPERESHPGEFLEWYPVENQWATFSVADQRRTIDDCEQFAQANAAHLSDPPTKEEGADFWYTRTGCGCGYWGGHYNEPDDEVLTAAARAAGHIDAEKYRGRWTLYPPSTMPKEPTP